MVRPTARPEPFSVCTNSGFFSPLRRKRACIRRAWKSHMFEQEEISRYVFCAGTQTSKS
ncbi:Uncharacterised protein [Vibrio cholerae]|nr:Uncharacterised protein [Vibrio cholerae]